MRGYETSGYTLAVRQLVAGETTSDVLAEFLELLDGLDLGVKAVYLDRGFYNSTWSQTAVRAQLRLRDADCQRGENDSDELNAAGAARLNTISPAR